MRIVIVEDEIKIRNGLARLLSTHEDTEVVGKAKNGREGLELIENLKPDLVFTDIQMPEMDGLDMLEALRKKGISCHSIILTGYAEFDYARRAVGAGADDYLLKPITIDDVERVLGVISDKLGKEASKLEANPEVYLKALLFGTLELSEDNRKKIIRVFDIEEDEKLILIYGRFLKRADEDELLKRFNDAKAVALVDEGMGCYLLYGMSVSSDEIVSMIKRRISVLSFGKDSLWILGDIPDILAIKKEAGELKSGILYSMALGDVNVFRKTDYEGKTLSEYPYSSDTEKQLERLLVNNDTEAFDKWLSDINKEIRMGRYAPQSVKILISNLANFIIQLSSKMWTKKVKQITDVEAQAKIAGACSIEEMLAPLKEMADVIFSEDNERENIRNYTLLKAIAYIREHYQEKISQEEVAEYLSITPEYLSTLFHREMNENFSAFINKFRVSHAKRLLKTTDLKVYEVAEQVGFSDTKYFNKVFKDVEGVSPKEFRL